MGFVIFSVSFQYFLKRVSALKFPITDDIYSLPGVANIKLRRIIGAKMGQHNGTSKYGIFV